MAQILILGASGFVGTHVCEKMVNKEWQVTAPTRRWAHAENLLIYPFMDVLELDVHDEATLHRTVAGHDAVVNLVGILHGNQAAFDHVHVALPQKLARACAAQGVKRLIHISALGADARRPERAPSMYLRSKSQGEVVLMEAAGDGPQAAFDLHILRPSVMFGAGDRFLTRFAQLQKHLPLVPLACAHTRFQPVWVEDVASAVVHCLEPDALASIPPRPPVLDVCGPQVFTLEQLVRLSAQIVGIREGRGRPVVPLPRWLAYLQAVVTELLPGEPLLSRDNLNSMRIDNVASGLWPGLEALGITPAALLPIAQDYLSRLQPNYGLLGIRQRAH